MERLMQYVWQHRLWPAGDMRTVDGLPVRIIDPGRLNTDAGPDFFNAKISIDGEVWAGDVEIHVKASDWYRHGHDGDKAYDSVILHVVDRDDAVVRRSDGQVIPQFVMSCAPDFHISYALLVDRSHSELPCARFIKDMSPLLISDWLTALFFERMYQKADRVLELLDRFKGDWESAAYVTLARCLGFGTNGEPFERLALSLPLRFLSKHADSLLSVEALLFGQAGLLDDGMEQDAYVVALRREYVFLSRKFGLKKPVSLGWKMSRMRPGNFPHRRIAMLAAIICERRRMMSRILEIETPRHVEELFSSVLTGYWSDHFTFGTLPAQRCYPSLGASSLNGLMINAVAPLQLAYAIHISDSCRQERVAAMLQSVPAERNSIVELFRQAGIPIRDASSTQAVIQLRRQYCEQHKCLYCRIGHRMLASKVRRPVG